MMPPISCSCPTSASRPSWAGVSPPRGGWVQIETIAASVLAARAQWGIAAVAESMPQNPGEDAVRAVRAAVWGAADDALGGLPLGVAFAAFTLGFIVGEEDAARADLGLVDARHAAARTRHRARSGARGHDGRP